MTTAIEKELAELREFAKVRFAALSREALELECMAMFDNLTSMQTEGTRAKNLREEICELSQQVVQGVPLGTSLPEQRLIVDKFRAAVAKLPKNAGDAGVKAPQKPRAKQGSKSVQSALNDRVASSGKTGLPE